ncbi:MAG: hypothetical protein Q8L55_06040, partial [Phycisphaerales bacterium]|nr:hypothetical protein [Phycisphaerales bacterium]
MKAEQIVRTPEEQAKHEKMGFRAASLVGLVFVAAGAIGTYLLLGSSLMSAWVVSSPSGTTTRLPQAGSWEVGMWPLWLLALPGVLIALIVVRKVCRDNPPSELLLAAKQTWRRPHRLCAAIVFTTVLCVPAFVVTFGIHRGLEWCVDGAAGWTYEKIQRVIPHHDSTTTTSTEPGGTPDWSYLRPSTWPVFNPGREVIKTVEHYWEETKTEYIAKPANLVADTAFAVVRYGVNIL